MESEAQRRMRYARDIVMAQHAHRAAEDRLRRNKAVRTVRAALARGMVTLEELTPLPNPNGSDQ